MKAEELRFVDDALFLYIPLEYGDETYKAHLVMTKRIFQECYKKWIEPQESKNNIHIPYLMHKEMGIPISECQKAYDVAIDYLRSKAKLKG